MQGVRDYIHVCDVAKGHVAAINHVAKIKGEDVVNLGTGRGYSVLEIVEGAAASCIPSCFPLLCCFASAKLDVFLLFATDAAVQQQCTGVPSQIRSQIRSRPPYPCCACLCTLVAWQRWAERRGGGCGCGCILCMMSAPRQETACEFGQILRQPVCFRTQHLKLESFTSACRSVQEGERQGRTLRVWSTT